MDRRQAKIAKKMKNSTEDRQNVQGEARERRETNNIKAEDRQDDSGDMQNGQEEAGIGQEEAGDRQEWAGGVRNRAGTGRR
jgi:hypothetical protein